VTVVTAAEAGKVACYSGGRYGSTDGLPIAAEVGRSSRGLPAPCKDDAICALTRHARRAGPSPGLGSQIEGESRSLDARPPICGRAPARVADPVLKESEICSAIAGCRKRRLCDDWTYEDRIGARSI
jgi:hypothetical protein